MEDRLMSLEATETEGRNGAKEHYKLYNSAIHSDNMLTKDFRL